MNASSRFLTFVVVGGALALAACGSELSPVASSTPVRSEGGTVSSSGRGPGAPTSPLPSPGTGTCTNDCGQGPGSGNGHGPGPGPSDGLCGNACSGPVGSDPLDIGTLLVAALQEEYRAQMLYRSVLQTFGAGTAPFALIEQAEARHVEALEGLFVRRQMVPPASVWTPGSFAAFASLPLACAAGVEAERADADFYTPHLNRTDLPQDVRNVFSNLQKASLENHLPAFERCR